MGEVGEIGSASFVALAETLGVGCARLRRGFGRLVLPKGRCRIDLFATLARLVGAADAFGSTIQEGKEATVCCRVVLFARRLLRLSLVRLRCDFGALLLRCDFGGMSGGSALLGGGTWARFDCGCHVASACLWGVQGGWGGSEAHSAAAR